MKMTLHICYTQRGREQGILFSPPPHTLPGLSPVNIPTLPAFQHLPPQGFLQAIPSTPPIDIYILHGIPTFTKIHSILQVCPFPLPQFNINTPSSSGQPSSRYLPTNIPLLIIYF